MPQHAKILSVAEQDGVLCLWAEVDTEQPPHDRTILIRGTGNPMLSRKLEPVEFIGTAVCDSCVWHIYELNHR